MEQKTHTKSKASIWFGKLDYSSFPEHHLTFNIFSAVTNLDALVKIIFERRNLYTQQIGREFQTNEEKMKAFLGISYAISVNKLTTIKNYC